MGSPTVPTVFHPPEQTLLKNARSKHMDKVKRVTSRQIKMKCSLLFMAMFGELSMVADGLRGGHDVKSLHWLVWGQGSCMRFLEFGTVEKKQKRVIESFIEMLLRALLTHPNPNKCETGQLIKYLHTLNLKTKVKIKKREKMKMAKTLQ